MMTANRSPLVSAISGNNCSSSIINSSPSTSASLTNGTVSASDEGSSKAKIIKPAGQSQTSKLNGKQQHLQQQQQLSQQVRCKNGLVNGNSDRNNQIPSQHHANHHQHHQQQQLQQQQNYQLQYQEEFNKMRERLFRLLSKVPIQVETVSSAPPPTPVVSGSRKPAEREPLMIKYYKEISLTDILELHFNCSLLKHNYERGLSLANSAQASAGAPSSILQAQVYQANQQEANMYQQSVDNQYANSLQKHHHQHPPPPQQQQYQQQVQYGNEWQSHASSAIFCWQDFGTEMGTREELSLEKLQQSAGSQHEQRTIVATKETTNVNTDAAIKFTADQTGRTLTSSSMVRKARRGSGQSSRLSQHRTSTSSPSSHHRQHLQQQLIGRPSNANDSSSIPSFVHQPADPSAPSCSSSLLPQTALTGCMQTNGLDCKMSAHFAAHESQFSANPNDHQYQAQTGAYAVPAYQPPALASSQGLCALELGQSGSLATFANHPSMLDNLQEPTQRAHLFEQPNQHLSQLQQTQPQELVCYEQQYNYPAASYAQQTHLQPPTPTSGAQTSGSSSALDCSWTVCGLQEANATLDDQQRAQQPHMIDHVNGIHSENYARERTSADFYMTPGGSYLVYADPACQTPEQSHPQLHLSHQQQQHPQQQHPQQQHPQQQQLLPPLQVDEHLHVHLQQQQQRQHHHHQQANLHQQQQAQQQTGELAPMNHSVAS